MLKLHGANKDKVVNSQVNVFLTALVFAVLSVSVIGCSSTEKKAESTRGYIDERNKPVEAYTGPTRTGSQVYDYSCATCHNRTTQGAPLPDDDIEWAKRLKKGKGVLLKHVMEGYKELMPVKGGCLNCTEEEVLAAIDYILKTSGLE